MAEIIAPRETQLDSAWRDRADLEAGPASANGTGTSPVRQAHEHAHALAARRQCRSMTATTSRRPPADPQKFRVEVRPSAIDGQGAFAAEAIPARRKIGEIRGEAISVREARQRARGRARIMIVEVSERRAVDVSGSTDPLRFTNHSCAPNAVLRIRQGRVELYAMRDLTPGEELTVNYGESHLEGRLACRCGAPRCAGRL